MKKITLSIIFLFLVESSSFTHIKHYENYNYLEYELFRNNKFIGKHIYKFKEIMEISQLIVKLAFKLKNLILFFTSIMLKAEEFYKNGKFFKFIANTLQNKKEKYVKINVDSTKKQLLIDGSSYKGPKALKTLLLGHGGIMK